MLSESRTECELSSTAPASMIAAVTAAVTESNSSINAGAKSTAKLPTTRGRIKRAHSMDALNETTAVSKEARVVKKPRGRRSKATNAELNAICYLSDDESATATNFDDLVGATTTKKPTTRKRKCGSGVCEIRGASNKKQHAAADDAQLVKQFTTSSTQTDIAGNCSTSSTTKAQKSLSDTVAESMTTFTATVSTDVNVLRTELHDVITTLIAQQDEIKEIRDALKQTSSQQAQLSELHNAVKHLSAQVNSLSASLTASTKHPPGSQYSASLLNFPPASNNHTDDLDFPPLPLPTETASQQQITLNRRTSPVQSNQPPSHQQPQSSHERLKQDVMAAMYVDLKSKQRRANNIIISGLQQKRDVSDDASVRNLLNTEFHCDVSDNIQSCKRIGKPQQDRPQPLLVTFYTNESAAHFIANAKKLRQSRNLETRNTIFISSDLTPSESKAAFEMRCRRREQQQQRKQTNNSDQLPQQLPASAQSTGRVFYRSQQQQQPPAAPNIEPKLVWRGPWNNGHDDERAMHTDTNTDQHSPTTIVNPAATAHDDQPGSAAAVYSGRPGQPGNSEPGN